MKLETRTFNKNYKHIALDISLLAPSNSTTLKFKGVFNIAVKLLFCKKKYKIIIIIKFLLYLNIVLKYFWSILYYSMTSIKVAKIDIYYVFFFIKESDSSYKLRYEGYLEIICKCLRHEHWTDPYENLI